MLRNVKIGSWPQKPDETSFSIRKAGLCLCDFVLMHWKYLYYRNNGDFILHYSVYKYGENMHKNRKCGFSLAEAMITILIIGILALLSVPVAKKLWKKTAIQTKVYGWLHATATERLYIGKKEWGTKITLTNGQNAIQRAK